MDLLFKIAVFHCYVSLPEGRFPIQNLRWKFWRQRFGVSLWSLQASTFSWTFQVYSQRASNILNIHYINIYIYIYVYNIHTNSLEYWNDMKIPFANIRKDHSLQKCLKKTSLFRAGYSTGYPNRSTFQPSSWDELIIDLFRTPQQGVWWLTFFPWDFFHLLKMGVKNKKQSKNISESYSGILGGGFFFFFWGGGGGVAKISHIQRHLWICFPTQIRRGRWTWWTKGGWVESRVVVGVVFFCCRKSFQDDLRFKSMWIWEFLLWICW